MKVVDFTQGSDEWLEWRRSGIGGSDISVLMGTNPYKTPYALWEEKCGYKDSEPLNAAMEHGLRWEENARLRASEQLGILFRPVCIEGKEECFKASLDGYNYQAHAVLEIKCPLSTQVIEAATGSNSVPSHWMDQLQWNMALAECRKGYFGVWDHVGKSVHIIPIIAEPERGEEMKREARKFWNLIRKGIAPALKDADYPALDNSTLRRLFERYEEIDLRLWELKELKEEQSNLKAQIIAEGGEKSFQSCGFRITKVSGRKVLDISKMKEEGYDLTPFERLSGPHYRIRKINEKMG